MKTAQNYIKGSGNELAGFNRRIHGSTFNEAFKYLNEKQDGDMIRGWYLAEDMIKKGKIYYLHNFHHSHGDCSGHAFQYGGFWVCNTCGQKGVNKDWWIIKVYQDGNAWCCVGEGFENLQASDNIAFGDTREEAIDNYGKLFNVSPDEEAEES